MSNSLERSQPDLNKPFILITDASDRAIGAILVQKDSDGSERMVYAFSRKLDKAEVNYGITDRELLAIVKSVQHFRHYLLGRKFILRTDHKALSYLHKAQNPNSRMLRWSLILQEFFFRIDYIKGEDNAADALSRPIFKAYRATTESFSQKQKTEILSEYQECSGHGSPETMKFLIKGRYS
ncbi:hypothetical protein PAEPH01_2619 [Pancytospora epiphaga]|nr:hypothetical protein PAEPH01_2619 [Pancytospora epiphaga]